jgi:hypothetical protein
MSHGMSGGTGERRGREGEGRQVSSLTCSGLQSQSAGDALGHGGIAVDSRPDSSRCPGDMIKMLLFCVCRLAPPSTRLTLTSPHSHPTQLELATAQSAIQLAPPSLGVRST